jgi:hypothetical protein
MGTTALRSHGTGKKHKRNLLDKKNTAFNLHSVNRSRPVPVPSTSNPASATSNVASTPVMPVPAPATVATMNNYLSKSEVMNAEIIWTLKTASSGYSHHSCDDNGNTFRAIFPDSTIAKVCL